MTEIDPLRRHPLSGYLEVAHRASDIVTQAIVDGYRGKWLAINLRTGQHDGYLYDLRSDAIRNQLHETLCMYVQVPMDHATPREMDIYLRWNREVYDKGYRMSDPEAPEPVMPNNLY